MRSMAMTNRSAVDGGHRGVHTTVVVLVVISDMFVYLVDGTSGHTNAAGETDSFP